MAKVDYCKISAAALNSLCSGILIGQMERGDLIGLWHVTLNAEAFVETIGERQTCLLILYPVYQFSV